MLSQLFAAVTCGRLFEIRMTIALLQTHI